MKRLPLLLITVLALLMVVLYVASTPQGSEGYSFYVDMQDQPSIKPQETLVRPPPPGSVPVQGREPLPVTRDIAELFLGRVEAAKLRNPTEPTAASIARGRTLFHSTCAVCHGKNGAGDGPVGEKLIARPFDLTINYVQQKPDGELFFTISNGSVVMPFYRDALTPEERWHLVNFIKQGLPPITDEELGKVAGAENAKSGDRDEK